MTRWIPVIVGLLAFDVCWAVSMFGIGESWWWAGPLAVALSVAAQLRISPVPGREFVIIGVGAAVGLGLDTVAVAAGVVSINSNSSLEFLVVFYALWVNFGSTLRPVLRWMWTRPWLAAVLGAVGGPAAYAGGVQIGAITLGDSVALALVWIGVQYAIATPLWMLIAKRAIDGRSASEQGGTDHQVRGIGATR